jgi:hypothetical protein
VAGVVRAAQPFTSPLSHRACVATRLVGEGPLGPVDDVCAIAFDVVTEEGERIRVSPARASVDLEVVDTPRPVRADRALLAFLTERGVFPRKGAVVLAEALLVEGERVVVEGYLGEPRTDPGGARRYREEATIRELSARGGVPLVIRRSLRVDGPSRAR